MELEIHVPITPEQCDYYLFHFHKKFEIYLNLRNNDTTPSYYTDYTL